MNATQISSHTVPKRLLRQFSYYDPKTQSPRLWRYEKGRKPYWRASPESSTAIKGHFSDPRDAKVEQDLESRLAYEIEDPVNQFLDEMKDPSFVLNEEQRRALTKYVNLLFLRSEAHRLASAHDVKIRRAAINMFLKNEQQIRTVAAHWNIQIALSGGTPNPLMTREDVIRIARHHLSQNVIGESNQPSYINLMTAALTDLDNTLFTGELRLVIASGSDSFILGDAPVVTWARMWNGKLNYGEGFARPDVELFMPVSPSTCWHILPAVPRTMRVKQPTVLEINTAQAKFARRTCFANIQDKAIDELVQNNISAVRLGENAYTFWHRLSGEPFYDTLMKLV